MSEQKMDNSPRENLIETAVKFLQNPKVRSSPFDSRKAFLKKKGLNDTEIDIAIERSGTGSEEAFKQNDSNSQVSPAIVTQPAPQLVVSKWSQVKDYTATAIVISGITYGIYFLYKNYIVPYLFGQSQEERQLEQLNRSISQLQQSMVNVVHTLEETQRVLSQQQENLQQIATNSSLNKGSSDIGTVQENYAVNEVKEEIKSLKGLLLSRRQFPPAPPTAPVIPSWQLTTTTSQTTTSDQMSNDLRQQENTDEEPSSSANSKLQEEKDEITAQAVNSSCSPAENGVRSVNSSDDEGLNESKLQTHDSGLHKADVEDQHVVSQVKEVS